MAFIHHPRPRPARDRQSSVDDQSVSRIVPPRASPETTQDWSIVFPGKARDHHDSNAAERAQSVQSSSASPADELQQGDALAVTLPPLHDGTGRFIASSEESVSPLASVRSPLSPPAQSEAYSDSIFSGITDSQDDEDADEEDGFGSGSDFESDAIASSIPSRLSAGQPRRRRPGHVRRGSRLSARSGGGSSAASDHNAFEPTASLASQRAWSWLSAGASGSIASQLEPNATARRFQMQWPDNARALSVISTSDSEQDEREPPPGLSAEQVPDSTHDEDLVTSNLAQSAGLSGSNMLLQGVRHPKRRHRHAAIGRSSKRSNTSQSRSVTRSISASQHGAPPSASTSAAAPANASASTRLARKLLKKLFDLEPEVLDSFLPSDPSQARQSGVSWTYPAPPCIGFGFDQGSSSLADVPIPAFRPRVRLLLDGREVEDLDEEADAGEGSQSSEEAEGTRTPTAARSHEQQHLDLTSSPLIDLSRPTCGESRPQESNGPVGLTLESLSRHGRIAGRTERAAMEPTTIEALQALMNSVMPVPMPFRILGALARSLGWWGGKSSSSSGDGGGGGDASESANDSVQMRGSEDGRQFRYDRLLSAQQAKAWSQRYRGMQLANEHVEDASMDVPECWHGNEHPALAGETETLF